MADAAGILGGRWAREIVGACTIIFYVFAMAAHIVSFAIMANTLSNHVTCTILFEVVCLVVSFTLTLPRRLQEISWMCYVSFGSISLAVLMTIVGVVIGRGEIASSRELSTPQDDVTLHQGILAMMNILFAYTGHVAFFSFMSELKDVKSYPKANYMLQGVDTTMYLVSAVVIYIFAGSNVTSPALDSAPRIWTKAAYGLAIPTIVMAGVINAHVAAKYVYVRKFKGTPMLQSRGWKAKAWWSGIAAALWIAAWLIAEAIPVFNDLLGLTSSLFASWFTIGFGGILGLALTRGRWCESWRSTMAFVSHIGIICLGALLVSLIS